LITKKEGRPVVIEDNVWIGMNCIILKGTRIGKGTIIGAGSVVRESIPPYSIAIGNPARVVKSFHPSRDEEI
jgi:acetyltransferase-like isoleucine patch superfamily enzyme